jgi:hypothetical protein
MAIMGKQLGEKIEWRGQLLDVIAIKWEHGFNGLKGFTRIWFNEAKKSTQI